MELSIPQRPPEHLLGLGSMRFADHSWKDNELEQSDRDDWKTHGHVAHETHDLAMRCEWNDTHPMGNKFIVEHTRIRFNLDPIDENNLQTSAMKTRLSEFATLRSVSSSENFTISSVSSRICTVGWKTHQFTPLTQPARENNVRGKKRKRGWRRREKLKYVAPSHRVCDITTKKQLKTIKHGYDGS
uniref:Uncharacterized protein n=1 Tax=Pristionchus pacificus TaxID=54126 RepID=A0A2A6CYF2_PRIPA|eukprot:PDM83097.1 hypothetical protein PRIPAC_37490 [Pristionchus pacificus]